MNLTTLTFVHVLISLVGIATGFVVAGGFLGGRQLPGWTSTFLVTTALTSATGFLFPSTQLLPSHIVGAISLVLLLPTILARYAFGLAGRWRTMFVAGSIVTLYLNFFVLLVQLFQKVPAMRELAPTQAEAPFALTQLGALVMFVVLGVRATRASAR